MSTKTLFILVIIVVVIIGVALFFQGGVEDGGSGDDSSGLVISNSAIYAAEQTPGRSVSVSVVRLAKSGFVVIHEDAAGAPGKILGVSSLLSAKETKNVPITLSRATTDGETIYAMLHFDNGDGKFDAANDKPALDRVDGAPMMTIVTVSKDATEEPEVLNP